MKVIKRNGLEEPFEWEKVRNALDKAFKSVSNTLTEDRYLEIIDELYFGDENGILRDSISVEELQDQLEQALFECGYFDVAKSFILYRADHKEERDLADRLNYIEEYCASDDNAAQSSETDPNANVLKKNVANLEGEVYKLKNRKLQRRRMYKVLSLMYPEVSKQYLKDLDSHIIYVHDEASSPVPKNYCEAVSLYPLMLEGVGNMDGFTPGIPKHVNSFCGQLNNLIFLLSSQCKGAVAIGELFNFLDYYFAKDFGEDYPEKEGLLVTSDNVSYKYTISDAIEQTFQNLVYYWNQPAGNRSFQSPFTNICYYDSNYWKALFEDFMFPDGTKPIWDRVDYLQKKFMKWFNKERTKAIATFPVETMCLLSNGKNDIIDQDYKQFTAEMYAEGHSFFTYISDSPSSLSSCCRLRNEIQENTFSFTNGLTGVRTGSCNVITINYNRVIQDYFISLGYQKGVRLPKGVWNKNTQLGFRDYLKEILDRVYKYHIAYKSILYKKEKQGMFSASNAGYISMSDLYCTNGLNGINEAAEYVGIDLSYNKEYEEFVHLIESTLSEENKAHSDALYKFNSEFVPAEGLSSKNLNWDKNEGYWIPKGRILYNSYFYNAHDDTSVLDKFKLHGKEFTSLLDGGVGLHCNLQEHLTKEQYLRLIEFAVEKGTSYFTFNIPNTQCDDCKHIYKYPLTKCPNCGSDNMTQWTRVVGFMRPIKGFDKYRYKEALQRTYSKNV